MLKIPYEVSGFGDIMNHDCYYIDKTLLIKELLDSQSRVIRLTLPAGFGATLGLGMLEYFFRDTKDSRKNRETIQFFEGKKIGKEACFRTEVCQRPVIRLDFETAPVPERNARGILAGFREVIRREYQRHVSAAENLSPEKKERFLRYAAGEMREEEFRESIGFLCDCLYESSGRRCILLMDHFRTCLGTAQMAGCYEKVAAEYEAMLDLAAGSRGLKLAVCVGQPLFGDSLYQGGTDHRYDGCFGFTEEEVRELLASYHLEEKQEILREWCGNCYGKYYPPGLIMKYLLCYEKYEIELEKEEVGSGWMQLYVPDSWYAAPFLKEKVPLLSRLNHREMVWIDASDPCCRYLLEQGILHVHDRNAEASLVCAANEVARGVIRKLAGIREIPVEGRGAGTDRLYEKGAVPRREKKRIPYCVEDFRTFVLQECYYVDKTLLIKEMLDSGERMIRLTLPAGFGATLGLGMLEYFFQDTKDSGQNRETIRFFEGRKIGKEACFRTEVCQRPVIRLDFETAPVPERNARGILAGFREVIRREYQRHVSAAENLSPEKKERFLRYAAGEMREEEFRESIGFLCDCLYESSGRRCILLMDHFRTCLGTAQMAGCYEKVAAEYEGMLDRAAGSRGLRLAVCVGQPLFGDSLYQGGTDHRYDGFFGFTEEEVRELLVSYHLEEKQDGLREWCGNYYGRYYSMSMVIRWLFHLSYDQSDISEPERWSGWMPVWASLALEQLAQTKEGRERLDVLGQGGCLVLEEQDEVFRYLADQGLLFVTEGSGERCTVRAGNRAVREALHRYMSGYEG